MSRAATAHEANNVIQAIHQLSENDKTALYNGLNADGIQTAGILLYYAPAFIQNAIQAAPNKKLEMLTKAYETMGHLYQNMTPVSNVQTVSLATAAQTIKENPSVSATELCQITLQVFKKNKITTNIGKEAKASQQPNTR